MIININETIALCETNLHIYSISTDKTLVNSEKKYYQHRHPGFEIHYVLSGEYHVTCNGQNNELKQNSLLLVPPGTYHNVTASVTSATRLCIIFNIHPHVAVGTSSPFYEVFGRSRPTLIELKDCEPHYILKRIATVVDDCADKIYKNDKLMNLCSILLLELIPYITAINSKEDVIKSTKKREDINHKIDTFLGTNFMHNGAKAKIAADLFISPRQLQRVIQRNYGMNYRQKLAETRAQIANDLLKNTHRSIHQISEILGYSCRANFSAFIKRLTGKTPSQIRKER